MQTFEQQANEYLVTLMNNETIIEGNLIGVREDLNTAKAIVSLFINDQLTEKHIAIYKKNGIIEWSFLNVIDKIQYNYEFIDDDAWHYPDFPLRIVAPITLANEYPQIKVWFDLRELPIKVSGDTAYLYCNFIEPMHQQLVDAIEVVTLEEKPE